MLMVSAFFFTCITACFWDYVKAADDKINEDDLEKKYLNKVNQKKKINLPQTV